MPETVMVNGNVREVPDCPDCSTPGEFVGSDTWECPACGRGWSP